MTMNKNELVMNTGWMSVLALAGALLAGCSNTPNRAPVEDRVAAQKSPTVAVAPVPAVVEAAKPLPGAENSGKPGYYTVKTGDTLIRIGLENGQNWKDLVKWNAIENPNIIEVGQVLRVVPPGVDPNAASSKPITTAKVETKPLEPKPAASAASGAASTPAPAATPAPAPPPVAREGDDDVNWAWPAAGPVIAPFDEGKVKGLVFAGKAGDPVLAAADGRVVYAGSGLRGYGNLVILKHNNTYLTAYAHNQTLLVKEDQSVRRGQKIAEMGSTDADGVKLHFEIRRQGKPVDPARLLPPR
ncbi:peptidoglycan DD-metalloendopeptidase family protein [Rhizobacter sp. Root404]|uniref:peptidoglycan DD-metalloendopeptidase family protein n=1 Tax=Rhizobacter sp. Root404 TaxID=1736528 RepID=UPI0006FCEEBA|nr:peptidoglycan DD-metalloendopeptidase family protein [Rhizobacter sp. Root404]KQW36596.1 peptidase [Rhizobacter sp. Root404]